MGVNLGSGPGRRLDFELNLVPMIDLMTCMTAFLLITAVWTSVRTVPIEPEGRKQSVLPVTNPPGRVSLLVQSDRIWIGDDHKIVDRWIDRGDLGELETQLVSLRGLTQPSVEIAGASSDAAPVSFQDLIDVMSTAQLAGYKKVGISDQSALTTAPVL